MSEAETYQFQAETQKLLNIIIHSIYTNKEIFLRELISNSSDALDKVRFEQKRGTEVVEPNKELAIHIEADQDRNRLIVSDSGIGMSKEEIVTNLGTIAKSGTEEFLRKVSEEKEHPDNIIGRFGVGFYSVFMVAKRVEITSRSAYPEAAPIFWSSDGMGNYEVTELEEEQPRGTRVEIEMLDQAKEYLEKERIKSIISKHSNFISFPIYVAGEKVNTIPALWKESKFNIKPEQYSEFYKFLTFDTEDPLETIHISVDAPVQFNSLLFIPPKSTIMFDAYNEDYGLDLYVNRVLIQRKNQDVIPQYLGFLRGLVDSEDLPLSLSREAIQESALIGKVNTTITKQVLSRLEDLARKDPEKYETFWREHGKVFKLGYTDFSNRDKFSHLLRFNSSYHQDASGLTSLKEYTERMKPGQKEIYYLSGPSRENILKNPHLEMFTDKGLEVLFLYEPVDEFVLQAVSSFDEYPLKAAEHVNPQDLDGFASQEEQQSREEEQKQEADVEKLLEKMKAVLGDRVTEVRASKRLSQSPACLVNPDGSMSSQMQKIMHLMQKDNSIPQQIMEINPKHPLVRNLTRILQHNPEDRFITTATEQLFEAALLQTGYLPDPHSLVSRTFELLDNAGKWYTQAQDL